jgi:hypothetical protein
METPIPKHRIPDRNSEFLTKLLAGIFRPFSPIYLKIQITDQLKTRTETTTNEERNTSVIPCLLPGMEEGVGVALSAESTRTSINMLKGNVLFCQYRRVKDSEIISKDAPILG